MPTFRDGQINLAGITNPGVYIDQILPTPFIVGVPTNIEAMVGVGSWGPVNAVSAFSDVDGGTATYGPALVRNADIMTHVSAATKAGKAINFRGVRVTDGTDTAATAVIQSTAGSFVARYTGSRGNQIGVIFQNSTAIGAYSCIISFPGRSPERFDNILLGLQSMTVAPGTGYTSVPTLSINAPQAVSGGVQATARASLVVVGTPTLLTGGTGHVVNDILTLGAGVRITVLTVTAGAVTTFSVLSPGSITAGSVPGTVGAQTASTGVGIGASFTLVWGLGPATITSGAGYYLAVGAPIVATMTGGGTGGSYTPVASYWANLAYAVNVGTILRGRSNYVVFSANSSTAVPTVAVINRLTGGADGAAGVGTLQLIGSDALPRTGMYALRGSGMDSFVLCDSIDITTWPTMTSFGISEGSALAIGTTASGDSIAGAVGARAGIGQDDPNFWLITGDWPTFYDESNGTRLVSPTAFAQGLLGNLSPEQSPINKQLVGVIATQTSTMGVLTSDADNAIAQTSGIDIIGRSEALGAIYFSFLTGRNTSSNTAAAGIEYTRLTAFIMRSLSGAATRSIVGLLQSATRANDPTRIKAKAILDSFFQQLVNPSSGSGGYGMIDSFATQCDETNNTFDTIIRGYLFAFCRVQYLNVVRYFVIKLNGGGNVQVTTQANPPSASQLALGLAA